MLTVSERRALTPNELQELVNTLYSASHDPASDYALHEEFCALAREICQETGAAALAVFHVHGYGKDQR